MKNDIHKTLGMQIGAALSVLDGTELIKAAGEEAVMRSEEGNPFNQELAKIASAAFDTAEDYSSPQAMLFKNLAKAPEWSTGYNRFTDCVKRAFSKQAGLLPAALFAHDSIGGGIGKNVMAGSVLGGMTAGSLAFLLAREMKQTSSENAQMMEKIKAFKKLKNDIVEDMDSRGVMDDTEEARYDV